LTVWMLISAGSVFVALRLLGVRDWRCYAIALLSAPAVSGLTWGNATLLLVPLVALGWRWRSHTYRGGAVLGVAIAAKLFLWPVVFWLLGTRRYRPVMATVVACAAFALLPWGMIGFRGFSSYPDLLRVAEGVYATHSFSIATMLRAVGVDADFAPRGGVAVGLALALFAFALARRGAEEAAFAVVILAAIVGSPIVWPYYYVLLVVPLAIVRPRFSLMWAALGLFYIADRLPRPWLDSSEAQLGGIACCLPDGVPLQVWLTSHSPAGLWPALAYAAFGCFIVLSCAFASAYRGLAPPVSRDDASEVPRSPTLTCSER
jgi:hypothetical protein